MVNKKRIVIIGGGIFGLTAAAILGENGQQVMLLEKSNDVMRGASFVNQNRIHMGYHYPRSPETIQTSLASLSGFKAYYSDAIVSNFNKYYAISKQDSLITADEFARVCAEWKIPLEPAWPDDPEIVSKDKIDACWLASEEIFDYHLLRRRAIELIRSQPNVEILRNTSIERISVGEPHEIVTNHGAKLEADFVINTAYAGITDLINLLGCEPYQLRFELCMMPIMKIAAPPQVRFGITIMDGEFGSLMPFGVNPNFYILAHVAHTPMQTYTGTERPKWDVIAGFPELDLIEASRKLFPILDRMDWHETWITTKIVLPNRDHDDARPTLLLQHTPTIYSLFSGKLTTCVDYARKIAKLIEDIG